MNSLVAIVQPTGSCLTLVVAKYCSVVFNCMYSPELRHVSGLNVMFWTFLSNLVFFIKFLLLIVYLYKKYIFSDNVLDLCGHVTDHALN